MISKMKKLIILLVILPCIVAGQKNGMKKLLLNQANFTLTLIDSSAVVNNPGYIWFKSDGTIAYITDGSNVTYQYSLSTAWDISTATYASKSHTYPSANYTGLCLSDDGTKVYRFNDGSNLFQQFNLSTAWDISTAATTANESSSATPFNTTSFMVIPGGSYLITMYFSAWNLYKYPLSTPYSVSTLGTETQTWAGTTNDYYIAFNSIGNKLFINRFTTNTIYAYDLNTYYDLSSITLIGNASVLRGGGGQNNSIYIGDNNNSLYISDITKDKIYQYTISF